tara:strand:- start:86 stop:586 length:501 start_codon:yes stop_codon:yes gene_type:complete
MNAKEKQLNWIKTYLKPLLKKEGFRTAGQTWWKLKDEFFILINLQNSQFNEKDRLSFCFTIGIGLNELIKGKPSHFDLLIPVREDSYLTDLRKKHPNRNGWLGYLITGETDMKDFNRNLEIDFENFILPKLNNLNSIDDCLKFYSEEKYDFWYKILIQNLKELKIK